MTDSPAPLRWALFTSATPGGPPGALWDHPLAAVFNYLDLTAWSRWPPSSKRPAST